MGGVKVATCWIASICSLFYHSTNPIEGPIWRDEKCRPESAIIILRGRGALFKLFAATSRQLGKLITPLNTVINAQSIAV